MNKIHFAVNADTNYVFHMLSVAKCGYDNAYGEKYRGLYPAYDLAVIRNNSEFLTVCGGEHLGALYWLMVCEPSCAKIPANKYYKNLLKSASECRLNAEYTPYSETIKSVSEIMIKHYNSYIENIWPGEKEKIEKFVPPVLDYFEKTDFTEKAEKLVGTELDNKFIATLVSSVKGGAEAIDISKEQDVFGVERSVLDSVYFIGHEFIIYLLFKALEKENAFKSFETWSLTEGLAEYYLKIILGDTRFFNEQQKYVDFYERCSNGAHLPAAELYKLAFNEI
ncbi:MAG: hypothetical protein IJ306_05460 [Oscillospiraceae bacterium]|nr:hypothetical protein [Oscillospiraceae bacterium]